MGNYTSYCYIPTLLSLVTLGIVHVLLGYSFSTSNILHGILQLALAYFAWEWYDLYGSRLTRRERVFFDEKNILDTSKAFDFKLGPVLDDTTPGGSGTDPCCGKYPTVEVLKGLMADPKHAEMQEVLFYFA